MPQQRFGLVLGMKSRTQRKTSYVYVFVDLSLSCTTLMWNSWHISTQETRRSSSTFSIELMNMLATRSSASGGHAVNLQDILRLINVNNVLHGHPSHFLSLNY